MSEEGRIGNSASGGGENLPLGVYGGAIHPLFRLLVSVVAYFASYFAAAIVASIVSSSQRGFDLVFRPLFLVLLLATFSFLLKTADEEDANPLAAMGLSVRKPWLRDISCGLLIGFLLIFIAYLVIRFTCELNVHITISFKTGKLLIAELFILATAAMAEEVAFRGYPFQRLLDVMEKSTQWLTRRGAVVPNGEVLKKASGAVAVLMWSSAFAAVHGSNPDVSAVAFVNTALIGVLFCVAYMRTRSLWMPWGIHFAWNTTLGVMLGLPVSGLTDFAVVVKSQAVGRIWITGGKYGLEASGLGTMVIAVGVILVLVLVKQRDVAEAATPKTDEMSFATDRVVADSIKM